MLNDSTFNRILITLGLWVIIGGLYLGIGHSVQPSGLREWVQLPLDNMIPYVPVTIFFYTLAFYVPLALAFLIIKGHGNFLRFNLAVVIGGSVNFIFFVLWPVGIDLPVLSVSGEIIGQYPYPIWELPGDTISPMIQAWIHAVDSTNNTIPSTHINYAVILAFSAQRDGSKWAKLLAFCAIGLIIVIATTKQHYFMDGVTGAVLGWGAFKFVFSDWMRSNLIVLLPSLAPVFNAPPTDHG